MSAAGSLPLRMLLRIVHHRRPVEEPGIALILRLAELSAVVRRRFENLLARLGLSERGFAALLALYSLDPEPVAPADLACYIDTSRSTVLTTLEPLIRAGHVEKQASARAQGAARLQLTPAGRELAAQAVTHLLDAAARIGRHLPRAACEATSALCDALQAECRAEDTADSATDSTFRP